MYHKITHRKLFPRKYFEKKKKKLCYFFFTLIVKNCGFFCFCFVLFFVYLFVCLFFFKYGSLNSRLCSTPWPLQKKKTPSCDPLMFSMLKVWSKKIEIFIKSDFRWTKLLPSYHIFSVTDSWMMNSDKAFNDCPSSKWMDKIPIIWTL